MQIKLEWARRDIPRPIQPLAKGTNTLVFADPDPDKVIVFLMCPTKYDWWHQCDLITNPSVNHIVDVDICVKGTYSGEKVEHEFILRKVQAKKLFHAEKGSAQKKEIAATVKAMDAIWGRIVRTNVYGGTFKNQMRQWSTDFWNEVYSSDLPTKELAGFAMDYYARPDLQQRNAMVDADGNIVWSDMLISENVMEFVHMRSGR